MENEAAREEAKRARKWERFFVKQGARLGARSRVFVLATEDFLKPKEKSQKEKQLELAVESGNAALRTAPKILRDDFDVVLASVRQCGASLCYASEECPALPALTKEALMTVASLRTRTFMYLCFNAPEKYDHK